MNGRFVEMWPVALTAPLPQVFTVVGGNHDNRVPGSSGLTQEIEKATDVVVGVSHRSFVVRKGRICRWAVVGCMGIEIVHPEEEWVLLFLNEIDHDIREVGRCEGRVTL